MFPLSIGVVMDFIKFKKLVDTLSYECENEEERKYFIPNLLAYGIKYSLSVKEYELLKAKMFKKGFSKRLITNLESFFTKSNLIKALKECLFDHFNYATNILEALKLQEQNYQLEEGELMEMYNFYNGIFSLENLNPSKMAFKLENCHQGTLALRNPTSNLLETKDSRYGHFVEKLLKNYGKSQYYQTLREAFVKFAVGIIDKHEWSTLVKPHKKFLSERFFEFVIKYTTTEIFTGYNMYILYGYSPEVICEFLGKITVDDFYYLNLVLGDEITKNNLKFADEIDPIPAKDLEEIEEILKTQSVTQEKV